MIRATWVWQDQIVTHDDEYSEDSEDDGKDQQIDHVGKPTTITEQPAIEDSEEDDNNHQQDDIRDDKSYAETSNDDADNDDEHDNKIQHIESTKIPRSFEFCVPVCVRTDE